MTMSCFWIEITQISSQFVQTENYFYIVQISAHTTTHQFLFYVF